MYSILKAIRARLVGDEVLAGLVNANNIATSHNAVYTSYPCIAIGITSSGSSGKISDITATVLNIDVYSTESKEQLWNIYERVKTLLLNQGHSISISQGVIHYVYEMNVRDNLYDMANNAWHLSAEYEIFYSTTGFNITTLASGVVYADKCQVMAIPSNEIARFSGTLTLDVQFESSVRYERERFGKNAYFHTGMARLIFSEMVFKASIIDILWNIDSVSSGKLNDGITNAAMYLLSQNSFPAYLQVLFQMVKSDDGKKLEIEADRALCKNLVVPFSSRDFCVFNCEWVLLGDSSGNVVRVGVEN